MRTRGPPKVTAMAAPSPGSSGRNTGRAVDAVSKWMFDKDGLHRIELYHLRREKPGGEISPP